MKGEGKGKEGPTQKHSLACVEHANSGRRSDWTKDKRLLSYTTGNEKSQLCEDNLLKKSCWIYKYSFAENRNNSVSKEALIEGDFSHLLLPLLIFFWRAWYWGWQMVPKQKTIHTHKIIIRGTQRENFSEILQLSFSTFLDCFIAF